MAVLFECAVNCASKVLRLELLRQFGEHHILYRYLEGVVLEFGDLGCEPHFEVDLHNIAFGTKCFGVPVFFFEAGLELTLVFELNCNFVTVFKFLFDSQPASYITNNYLPRMWHRVIFVFIIAQKCWYIDAARVVAFPEKETGSLRQPTDVLVSGAGFNSIGARHLLGGSDKDDQLHN